MSSPQPSRPRRRAAWLSLFLAVMLSGARADGSLDPAAVAGFVADMHARHGFDASTLNTLFARAQRLDGVLAAISKPAEYKPWHAYRPIFLTRSRIDQGVAFWNEQAPILAAAEQKTGVPAEIIVAIIGVETAYGRNTGSYRVLDALATLAFHYPKRAPFFRSELENFLLLAREEHVDPMTPTGSYAGAMGLPQFMPSSFRRYAVDFDADGHRDIWRNPRDAIGSVGNYLEAHGWRAGEPIAVPAAQSDANAREVRDAVDLKYTIAQYAMRGVRPLEQIGAQYAEVPAVLLGYESSATATEYWLGLRNFYAITRYNRSPKYALAVFQLADAIARARGRTP
ncbi:MAG TPA: lytic murein transglycosylase B [Gammaproteobacteria bacterium]|nr:lytic murein transglycosylase B [Gammaproteobacteria bacterium]